MGITIIVGHDSRVTVEELDAHVARLEEFVADKAEATFRDAGLDSYLVDILSRASIIHRERMFPKEPDNIEIMEEVRERSETCLACEYHHTLLNFATCLGTWDEYYALRRLMDLHYIDECRSTTYVGDGRPYGWL